MTGELKCGFCERAWEDCETDHCPERTIVLAFKQLLPATGQIDDAPSMNDPVEYLSWIVAGAETGRWHLSGRDVMAIANAVEMLKGIDVRKEAAS